ncbi:hypothetical protein HK105_204338 [Polyrhizophydium stewartii]|uniref:Transposase n=1 Tax=Polyrhizophydium stewartii TaxID=2732419 RepID=A0ABR4N9S1_9FUNG
MVATAPPVATATPSFADDVRDVLAAGKCLARELASSVTGILTPHLGDWLPRQEAAPESGTLSTFLLSTAELQFRAFIFTQKTAKFTRTASSRAERRLRTMIGRARDHARRFVNILGMAVRRIEEHAREFDTARILRQFQPDLAH